MPGLSPPDAAVAVRSLPRRWRALLGGFDDDEDPGALVRRRPPDGRRSALELAARTASVCAMVEAALADVLHHHRPTLDRALLDDAGRPEERPVAIDPVLDRLTAAADRLATTVEEAPSDAWGRVGVVEGRGEATALDLVREAVEVGTGGLREAAAVLRAVRGRPTEVP